MKRNTFILFLIFAVLLSACKTGKKNDDKVDIQEVKEEYFFPEEVTYYQNMGDIIPDKFYPIGWSKNGNFAYIIEPADEGLGNYMIGVVVVSLVSNEVLWDWFTDPVVDEDLYREDIWKKHYDLFKEKLNKFGIIQQKDMQLLDSYFTYDKKDFILKLDVKKEKDPDMGIEIVSESKLLIKCPQLGEKEIAKKNYEASMILGQQIAGCFISPYEDRIAIIVKSERWGYEGPPNIIEFEIFGTNLSTGFVEK